MGGAVPELQWVLRAQGAVRRPGCASCPVSTLSASVSTELMGSTCLCRCSCVGISNRAQIKLHHFVSNTFPLPESHGQNLALPLLYVPYSLESGLGAVDIRSTRLRCLKPLDCDFCGLCLRKEWHDDFFCWYFCVAISNKAQVAPSQPIPCSVQSYESWFNLSRPNQ